MISWCSSIDLCTTSNVIAIKFTLLQCKCPSKLRHSEVLEWNKEGKDMYEDKLPAQGDVWGGQCLNVFRSWL